MPTIRPMGPCRVVFTKYDGTTQTVQKTHGGVRWTEVEAKADVKYDQTGTVPADKMSQGHDNYLEIPIGLMDFSVLSFCDPSVQFQPDSINPNKVLLLRTYRIGGLDTDILLTITLTVYKGGVPSADPNDTFTFPACAVQIDKDMMFNADTQRAYKMRVRAYQDTRRVDTAVWMVGDTTTTPATPFHA